METDQLTMFNQTVLSEEGHFWIKPVCDFFQIDYQNQVLKIKNDHILMICYGKKRNKMQFGDNYNRIYLTKMGFLRWIQLINPNTVMKSLQEKFKQYQTLIVDFLFGSAEEHEDARTNYNRLHKLERLYGIIGQEIRRTKKILHQHWDNRYMQTQLQFHETLQIDS